MSDGGDAGFVPERWLFWYSGLMVTLGAAFWLAASLVVAFPSHLAHAEFGLLFGDFLRSPYHPLSVLFLFVIDVMIAILMLNNSDVRAGLTANRRLGIVLAALSLYGVLAVILPYYNASIPDGHAVQVGLLALLCIGVPRAMSYAAPQLARAVPI